MKSTSAVGLWHSLGCQRCRVRLVVKPTIIASLSACQKVAQSIYSFLKYSINISPVFDHAHPKQLEVIFTCPEFVSTFEKSVYYFYSFFRYSQCWSPVSRVLKPTRPYPPKSFSINFNFHKFNFFLKHAKNQADLSFCFRDTVNFKILQCDWLIAFYLVSGTRFFSKHWICAGW